MTDAIDQSSLHQLSDDTWVTDDDGDLRIYQHDETGRLVCVSVLSDSEAWELVGHWLDGYCPVCGISIPQDHAICESCARAAVQRWGIREAP